MCHVLEVSRSGFYRWMKRKESKRSLARRRFDVKVKAVFEARKKRYGSPKITEELRNQGIQTSRSRVAASMKRQGLRSKVRRKYRVTTDSKHSYPVADNLLNRNFTTQAANQVWVSDITYIPSRKGWLYLTVILDLFSRMVVGWCISSSLGHEMVLTALKRALWRRRPPEGLLFHSDRGVQYCCEDFRKETKEKAITQSMSRKGNCWDNAVAESFFRSFKTECMYHVDIVDLEHSERVAFEYIEGFYNNQRLHQSNGYLSPAEFERLSFKKCA
jgi:putative transposase